MNICDNSLLRAEAFLNSADKAATRFHDVHISAQAEFTLAKLEWAKEPVGETWAQRCARVIPNVKQGKIDDTVAGRFPKIVQETALVAGEGLEDRIRELMGDAYRAAEARRWAMEELAAAMAAKRSALASAAATARHDADRGGHDPQKNETKAEKLAEARKEAEAIRVANGGAPAQVRAPRAPVPAAPAPVATYDKERDDLMILVISKLRGLSVADLNEINDHIDALTYPLRKPL